MASFRETIDQVIDQQLSRWTYWLLYPTHLGRVLRQYPQHHCILDVITVYFSSGGWLRWLFRFFMNREVEETFGRCIAVCERLKEIKLFCAEYVQAIQDMDIAQCEHCMAALYYLHENNLLTSDNQQFILHHFDCCKILCMLHRANLFTQEHWDFITSCTDFEALSQVLFKFDIAHLLTQDNLNIIKNDMDLKEINLALDILSKQHCLHQDSLDMMKKYRHRLQCIAQVLCILMKANVFTPDNWDFIAKHAIYGSQIVLILNHHHLFTQAHWSAIKNHAQFDSLVQGCCRLATSHLLNQGTLSIMLDDALPHVIAEDLYSQYQYEQQLYKDDQRTQHDQIDVKAVPS